MLQLRKLDLVNTFFACS